MSVDTTGGVNATVLMRAGADSPTVKRAICWASRMFTVPSPVASPSAASSDALATLRATGEPCDLLRVDDVHGSVAVDVAPVPRSRHTDIEVAHANGVQNVGEAVPR